MTWAIRHLDDQVDRRRFSCGTEALDDWLVKQAGQVQRKRLASVWIASPADKPGRVAGYYSLAPWQVAFEHAPRRLTKRLPRYPLAATLIARLAVDRSCQGKGLGGILLVDALQRTWRAAQTIPVQAVLVHAKDERAAGFYRRFGFEPFDDSPLHLFLAMGTVERLVGGEK